MKKILGLLPVMIILFALIGCATPMSKQQAVGEELKPEKEKLIQIEEAITSEGEIDSLKTINESFPKRGEVAFVLIGFKAGNGVIAKGIYPGLKEGKKVKLYLKPSGTMYKGSQTYDIEKIEGIQ